MFDLIEVGDMPGLKARLIEISKLSLQAQEAELTITDVTGKTLLHAAILAHRLDMIHAILSVNEVLLNKPDAEGNTPLHLAIINDVFAMVEALLSYDASLIVTNAQQQTPIQLAEALSASETNQDNSYAVIVALLTTRQSWQAQLPGLQLNRVIRLLQQVYPAIRPAAGYNKLLLIGPTGSGKSTLLNFMGGTQYEVMLAAGKPSAKYIGGVEEIAQTGQGMVSETLYPKVLLQDNHRDYVFCDLAGLFDSHGDVERICAASSIQMLTRLPGKIKGLCVTLELPSFYVGKGESFKKTAVALSRMLRHDATLLDSVYFVITKVIPTRDGDITALDIIDIVNSILADAGGLLAQLRQRQLNEEERALLWMLQAMINLKDRILIADISKPETRIELTSRFHALLPMESERFDFISHDEVQIDFNRLLASIACWYVDNTNKLAEYPRKIAVMTAEKETLCAEILQMETQVNDKKVQQQTVYSSAFLDQQILEKRRQIQGNLNQINARNIQISDRAAAYVSHRHQPLSFSWNYQFEPEPGLRTWSRLGITWTERYPSGQTKTFQKISAIHVDGVAGSLVQHIFDPGFQVFIPDVNSSNRWLRFRCSGGSWNYLGEMQHAKEMSHEELQTLEVSDRAQIQLLIDNNQRIHQEILNCESEKVQGALENEMRKRQLDEEIQHLQEAITHKRQALDMLSIKINDHRKQIGKIILETKVNQSLINFVYMISRDLNLIHDVSVAQFWATFEANHPELVAAIVTGSVEIGLMMSSFSPSCSSSDNVCIAPLAVDTPAISSVAVTMYPTTQLSSSVGEQRTAPRLE